MRRPPTLLFPTRPTKSRTKCEEPQESPTTPTRNRTAPVPKPSREHLLKLPKVTDAVLCPGLECRWTLSLYETFGESDEEADSGAEGDEEVRKEGLGKESLVEEWSRLNLGSRVKH